MRADNIQAVTQLLLTSLFQVNSEQEQQVEKGKKNMYGFFKEGGVEGLKIVDKVNRNAEVIVKMISSIKSCDNRKGTLGIRPHFLKVPTYVKRNLFEGRNLNRWC